jgi:hypothetical protein
LNSKKIVIAALIGMVSLPLIGANEYNLLNPYQTSNLKLAAKTGVSDGHKQYVMPAIIYQESKAGQDKDHPVFIGIGQVSIIAAREVLIEYPEVGEVCGNIHKKSAIKEIRRNVHHNDKCGITMASKYLAIIRDKYKIRSVEHQIVAYQMGPIAARRVQSSAYSRSVLTHAQYLIRIFRS